MNADEWITFKQRLAETIAWCDLYANLDDTENCLRNFELLPDEFKNNLDDMWISPSPVDSIAQKRAELLRQRGKYPLEAELSLHEGRLLIYFFGSDTNDGTAYNVSEGFVGSYHTLEAVPPWDTWIQLEEATDNLQAYLVSWIPKVFCSLADEAVQFDPLQIVIWIECPEFDSDLKQQLIASGLLK